nr:hypothetical protein [Tanacetum cinerariifolium]
MHQFWFTINKHDSSYQFKIGKKRFTLNMEVFREIFQICPRLSNQDFDEVPSDEEIFSFIKELGHKRNIKSITGIIVDQMHQSWTIFASIINKCLSGKITGGSGDETSSKPGVPVEPKGKSIVTNEGTGLKLGVPDVSKANSSKSETDSKNQEINDDKKESDNEFVHNPKDYVPTDDEMNDETKDVDEEEYDRIAKELYGDVNVPPLSSSHSISFTYTNAFPNLENLHSTKMKVVSMLDINVQHEVPRTSPLLTIPIFVILEHTIFSPSETVTTALATTITSLLSSLFLSLQQSIPILTPTTTTKATTSTIVVPESETLSTIHQSITDLEKDVKELKIINTSTTVVLAIESKVPNAVKEYLESSLDDALYKQYAPQKSIKDILKIKMKHTRKQQVPKETITSFDTAALKEFNQKTTLFNTMTKSKSFNKSPKHRALYHALMESILKDEDTIDKGVADELKKRKLDDVDKDEGPTAGSDRRLNRKRTSKGTKTLKKTSAIKDSYKGKSHVTSSKSSKSGKSTKDQVVKPISMQDSENAEHDDAEYANMPID